MAQNRETSNKGPAGHRQPPLPPLPPPPPTNRKIHKVPNQLLKEEEHNRANYIPKVVSIGPYHHEKSELHLAESFKPVALKFIVSGNKVKEAEYHQKIKKMINHIRACYEEHTTDSYSDDRLAHMMLLDACFIIIHIETSCINEEHLEHQSDHGKMVQTYADHMSRTLGRLNMSFVLRDMFLLENQIPLWIVKLLLSSRYGEDGSHELLNRYLTRSLFGEFRSYRNLPTEYPEELHLLEAFRNLFVFGSIDQPNKTSLSKCNFLCCCKPKENTDPESGVSSRGKSRFRSCMNDLTAKACGRLFKNCNKGDDAKGDLKKFIHSFRSATDLKARGIHFKPGQTLSLKDVKFESYRIYAKLQLPIWCVSIETMVFLQNMIVYELNPNNRFNNNTQGIVTTYINLMKSLIVKREDVKELREKKILFCLVRDDKQILKLYQGINTYGANNPLIFQNVKDKIQAHYNSRRAIWIAEFIHDNIRTPWRFAAWFAALCILVLTILQTIYTMKSYSKGK